MHHINSKALMFLPAALILSSCATTTPYGSDMALTHTFVNSEQLLDVKTEGETFLVESLEPELTLTRLNNYFDVDGEIIRTDNNNGYKTFMLTTDPDSAETIKLTVNELPKRLPVWTYYNPNTVGERCCSCGFCGGEQLNTNQHEVNQHDTVDLNSQSVQLQADNIMKVLGFTINDYVCEYEGGWVNKVECFITLEGVKTPLRFGFFFDNKGELHTATGEAFTLEPYGVKNYVSDKESTHRLNDTKYHAVVLLTEDGLMSGVNEVFDNVTVSSGLVSTFDGKLLLAKSFTYTTGSGVSLGVTALEDDVIFANR